MERVRHARRRVPEHRRCSPKVSSGDPRGAPAAMQVASGSSHSHKEEPDAEDYWSQTVHVTKEAYTTISTRTLVEGMHADGAASRLLGLRMPEKV